MAFSEYIFYVLVDLFLEICIYKDNKDIFKVLHIKELCIHSICEIAGGNNGL